VRIEEDCAMRISVVAVLCALVMHGVSCGDLSSTYYDTTCPNLYSIVYGVINNAYLSDPRIAANLLRLHFHDCFVQVSKCSGNWVIKNVGVH